MASGARVVGAVVVGALACGDLGAAAELRLPTIPAHWVEDAGGLEPLRGGEFTFDSLSFSSRSEGWFVGNRYILHLSGDRLELQFLRDADISLFAVHTSATAGTFAGGVDRSGKSSQGIVLRRDGGAWNTEVLQSNGLQDWFVGALSVNAVTGWGIGVDIRAQGPHDVLWQRDNRGWWITHTDEDARGAVWAFADLCLDPSGDGWLVGSEWTDGQVRRALMVRRSAGDLVRVALPDLPGPNSYVTDIACLEGGKALAAAVVNATGYSWKESGGFGILLAYDGSWHPIELPPHLRKYRVAVMAALSGTDARLVLTAHPRDPEKFVHWHDQRWEEVPAPVLPEGRTSGYAVTDMQFVSPSEGWAVAIDSEGPVMVRGLIFHYRDGVWRNRNWNWHFWDQRWFGLFGD